LVLYKHAVRTTRKNQYQIKSSLKQYELVGIPPDS